MADLTIYEDLRAVVNRHSIDAAAKTPDFIIARHLMLMLDALVETATKRDVWWGVDLEVGGRSAFRRAEVAALASEETTK